MIFLILGALIAILLVHQFWFRRLGMPPGPLPLPIVGNVPFFWYAKRWEYKFLEWRDKYGPIYTYFLGLEPVIAVNEYKVAHDLFVKDSDAYADRHANETIDYALRGGMYGIIESSGGLWRDQRRFTLKALRDFGLGKNLMEQRILDEVQYLYEKMDREIESGAEIDFHRHTDIAVGSVINSVVNGYRFTANGKEAEFYRLKDSVQEAIKRFSNPLVNLSARYPVFAKIPYANKKFQEAVDFFTEITRFLDKVIEEHIKNRDYSEEMEPNDFIDAYLAEMKRCEERGEPGYFSKIQLRNIVMDLFLAGQETTSTTLTWAIAFMIRHPEMQRKMQQELDKVVDKDGLISISNKLELPYTNAIIMEVQRLANIVPQNLPRRTTKEVEINGYKLKKGTVIVPQISVMLIDPNLYENPLEFNPSRFIDEKGQLKKADELIPFSLGKRQCVGEGLARMELFLFVANIFHRYEILSGKEPPTLEKKNSGFSPGTKDYKCRVNKRF